jgi:hypothetical protein
MVIETPVIDINNSTLILGLDPVTRFYAEELQAAYRIDDPEDDDLEIDEPTYGDDDDEDEDEEDEYEDDDEDEDDEDEEDDDEYEDDEDEYDDDDEDEDDDEEESEPID